jgi:glutamine synthetase
MKDSLKHAKVESYRAAVCDLNGVLRGKRIPASQLDKAIKGSMRMPLSVAGVDIWGEDVIESSLVFESGDEDGLCEHTGRDILPISWTKSPTALIPLWLAKENGEPFNVDPRRALANIVNAYTQTGLTPVMATELEFYLTDAGCKKPKAPKSPVTGKRLDSDSILSIDELDHFDAFFTDVYKACEEQNIPADTAIAENGCGQFEINLMHSDNPLKAADDAVYFKNIVKGIARKHGCAATFMAKPYGDRSGNGFHVHFSLVDMKGKNVFNDGTEKGTEMMNHAVAGLMKAMPECTLLFAPHMNSYRRLRPGTHAPTSVTWGFENRTTSIRIPGGSFEARRIEHRVAGADANPYLVIAAILGAALYGINHKLEPIDPVQGNAYEVVAQTLPSSWNSALETFEKGQTVRSFLSPEFIDMYCACKKQEMDVFAKHVTDFEYNSYLETV